MHNVAESDSNAVCISDDYDGALNRVEDGKEVVYESSDYFFGVES